MTLMQLIFHQHLPTGTTGRSLTKRPALINSDNSKRLIITHVWMLGRCRKYGRALGTESRGVGGVFLIVTAHHRAVGKAQRSTYMEPRIWGISTFGGLNGLLHQRAVDLCKLFQSVLLIIDSMCFIHF